MCCTLLLAGSSDSQVRAPVLSLSMLTLQSPAIRIWWNNTAEENLTWLLQVSSPFSGLGDGSSWLKTEREVKYICLFPGVLLLPCKMYVQSNQTNKKLCLKARSQMTHLGRSWVCGKCKYYSLIDRDQKNILTWGLVMRSSLWSSAIHFTLASHHKWSNIRQYIWERSATFILFFGSSQGRRGQLLLNIWNCTLTRFFFFLHSFSRQNNLFSWLYRHSFSILSLTVTWAGIQGRKRMTTKPYSGLIFNQQLELKKLIQII